MRWPLTANSIRQTRRTIPIAFQVSLILVVPINCTSKNCDDVRTILYSTKLYFAATIKNPGGHNNLVHHVLSASPSNGSPGGIGLSLQPGSSFTRSISSGSGSSSSPSSSLSSSPSPFPIQQAAQQNYSSFGANEISNSIPTTTTARRLSKNNRKPQGNRQELLSYCSNQA